MPQQDKTFIVIEEKTPKEFVACIKGNPRKYGCGVSIDAAIGALIRSHQETFASISIEFDPSIISDTPNHLITKVKNILAGKFTA